MLNGSGQSSDQLLVDRQNILNTRLRIGDPEGGNARVERQHGSLLVYVRTDAWCIGTNKRIEKDKSRICSQQHRVPPCDGPISIWAAARTTGIHVEGMGTREHRVCLVDKALHSRCIRSVRALVSMVLCVDLLATLTVCLCTAGH